MKWKLVPVEATDEMGAAYYAAEDAAEEAGESFYRRDGVTAANAAAPRALGDEELVEQVALAFARKRWGPKPEDKSDADYEASALWTFGPAAKRWIAIAEELEAAQ